VSDEEQEERPAAETVSAKQPTPPPTRRFAGWHLGVTLLLGVAVGAGGLYGLQAGGVIPVAGAKQDPRKSADKPNAYVPVAPWTAVVGPAAAKVTIVEFSDFQCPHCARLAPVLKQVAEKYEGSVSVHLRNFPLAMHKQAEPAARAMQAAQRQGKALEMSDKMFANMKALSDDELFKYAEELGLDTAKFKADFESQEVKDEVAKDLQAGKDASVRGTPAVFVNGLRFQGPRTVEGFKEVVEAEIAKADALIKSGTPIEKVYETLGKQNAAPAAPKTP
jgi:protein-disulfide isomerase